MAEKQDGHGFFKRFNGEGGDVKAYEEWKTWAQAALASKREDDNETRGPWL